MPYGTLGSKRAKTPEKGSFASRKNLDQRNLDDNSRNQTALQSSLSNSIHHWDFLSLAQKKLNIFQDRMFFSIQRFVEGDQKHF